MQKQTKTEIVRTLLAAGELSPAKIAKKVGVSKSYVYNVRMKLAKKGKSAPTAEVVAIPSEGARVNSGNGHDTQEDPILRVIADNDMSYLTGTALVALVEGRVHDAVKYLNREISRTR